MIKVLFICGQNRLRSPTAEAVFSEYPGVEALSAGLNNDAECPVSADLGSNATSRASASSPWTTETETGTETESQTEPET